MKNFGEPVFDVIIDDGSHRPDHQQISLSFFFRKLKKGGLYFIEDLASNGFGDTASDRHSNTSVLNTRKVVRNFWKQGEFPTPNLIDNPEFSCPCAHIQISPEPQPEKPFQKSNRLQTGYFALIIR